MVNLVQEDAAKTFLDWLSHFQTAFLCPFLNLSRLFASGIGQHQELAFDCSHSPQASLFPSESVNDFHPRINNWVLLEQGTLMM